MNHTRTYWMPWLICFLLLTNAACTAVEAPAVAQLYPMAKDGIVLAMSTPSTYAMLNNAFKDAATPILTCPNCTHVMVRYVLPGWSNAYGVALINTTEQAADYWSHLSGMVVTKADWGLLKDSAMNVGFTETTPKDIALTPLALRIAEWVAGVGAGAGETMLAGAMLTMDDYMSIVEQELGMEDY